MKKILVPVDFSPNTWISCDSAREMALATGAEIILFHSFFEQIYFSDGGFATGFESGIMLTDEIILDFYRQKEKQLKELSLELGKPENGTATGPAKVSYVIETGDPQVQILTAIEKYDPDLVMMGSAGLGKKGFLAGSVSKHIMDNTNTPVMAIPDKGEIRGFENILYVTDFEEHDSNALIKLSQLFKGWRSNVHCLHFNVEDKDKDSGAQMDLMSRNEALQKDSGNFMFHVITCKDARNSLMDYISENNIHFIAFIPHKKNFFSIFSRQDLTKEDLFQTGLPILGIK